MRAAWYERNGPAMDVLQNGEMPDPEPEDREVRVRIWASGVNPSDVKSRQGRPLAGPRVIPHSDGAGVIESVGKLVANRQPGERVWIWNGQWKRPFGTAAEFICVPERQAVPLPEKTTFATGACLGIPALTAVHALRAAGPLGGRTLLITGAGSAVGHYATQIAKLAGARVIGTASDSRAAHARDAGADFVVDYKSKDVAKVVRELTKGNGVDAIIDMDLSSTASLIADQIVRPHGTIVCYGSNQAGNIPLFFPALLWNAYTLKFFVVYELTVDERAAALAQLQGMLEQQVLKHAIAQRFPLNQIAAAHEAVEAGRLSGNVVLEMEP